MKHSASYKGDSEIRVCASEFGSLIIIGHAVKSSHVYGLHLMRQHSSPSAQKSSLTRTPRLLRSTHSFNCIPGRRKELGRHLLIARIVGVLAIRRVRHGIETRVIVDEDHGTVARVLVWCVLLDGVVEGHNAINSSLGPARRVQGQQVGEDDAHLGVLRTHLADQDVVGCKDVVGGLFADEYIVGSKQHDDDIRRVGVQPDSQVAVLCVVSGKRAGVAFVLLVCSPAAGARLCANEVEVGCLIIAQLGLKIRTPTSLEDRQ